MDIAQNPLQLQPWDIPVGHSNYAPAAWDSGSGGTACVGDNLLAKLSSFLDFRRISRGAWRISLASLHWARIGRDGLRACLDVGARITAAGA